MESEVKSEVGNAKVETYTAIWEMSRENVRFLFLGDGEIEVGSKAM